MAIRSCVLIGESGTEQLTGGKRVITYQSQWKLLSTIRNESPRVVLAHHELPGLVATWRDDNRCVCVKRDPKQQKAAEEWIVTLDYTNSPDIGKGEEPEQAIENPLLRPAKIDRSPFQRQRIVERDAYDRLIVNTAGEKFNPPVERDEHNPGFTLTKNVVAWPSALEYALIDSINLSPIVIPQYGISCPARSLKFNGFSGGMRWESGYRYWEISPNLEVDWQGWNKPIVSLGYNEKLFDAEAGEFVLCPIIGGNGERPAEPVLLDANGMADPYRTDNPYLLNFRKYREIDHTPLFQLLGML